MLAASMLTSQVLAAAPVHTSMLSVKTPKRNGYERLQTVVSVSLPVIAAGLSVLKCLPQNRSMPTAAVVMAAMVEVCPKGI